MNTSTNCIARNMRQLPGNNIHRLLTCEAISTSRAVRTVKDDINTTEVLFEFKDGSQIRMTDSSGKLLFIASKGPRL